MGTFNWQSIITFLAKTGFVYQTNKSLGGFRNSWDYGPYGTMLKENILNCWKKCFIDYQTTFLMEANHFLKPETWKISKHVDYFQDNFRDCLKCKKRFREDQFVVAREKQKSSFSLSKEKSDLRNVKCPNCNSCELTPIRAFNLLFETTVGALESRKNKIFLRPELAQGIFASFPSIINSLRVKIPFGIGQIGNAFRNEITTNSFLYKTRSFQMAELEFFVVTEDETKYFTEYCRKTNYFLTEILELKQVKEREISEKKLAHYSKRTIDFEYQFNHHSFQELCGVSNRGNYDLTAQSAQLKTPITILNHITNKRIIPSVIEVSMGVDRLFLAIISQAYHCEKLPSGLERELLKLPTFLAPYSVAVNSLTKKQNVQARKIFEMLRGDFSCLAMYKQSIGKRYRIQDCLGVKYNITVDFDTNHDECVSIRDRDSMKQKRVLINKIKEAIRL